MTPSAEHRDAAVFALDRGNKCLWRDGERLDLTPKAFAVLDFLRLHPGRLVTNDDILDAVWPNTFVQPEIVKTYIRTLRLLLRDDAREPRFIETRPRSGYRFVGQIPERTGEATAVGRASTLIGREAEIALAGRVFAAVERGSRDAVVVTGESGIGKSALLAHLSSELKAGHPRVVTAAAYGRPSPLEAEPLSLVISLLRDLSRAMEGGLLDCAASQGPSWLGLLPEDGRGPRSALRERRATGLATLVREACEIIERVAQDRTVVLAIDDLQWADAASLAFVVELMRRRYPARILLLVSFRQVEFFGRCGASDAVRDLVVHDLAREIALSPLRTADIERLVRAEDRDATADRTPDLRPSPAVGEAVALSGGNPFMAKMFARSLAGDVGGRAAGSRSARRRLQDETVYRGLDLQLNEFGPLLRNALEAGSVAGPRFCAWAVATMLEAEHAQIEDVIARVVLSRQFLVQDAWYSLPDGSTTPIYAFKHPAQRQFLRDSQAPSRRGERHRRLGQAIVNLWGGDVKEVAADVSFCFKGAGDWSRAIGYARLAASRAVERASPDEATRHLKEALGLSSKLPVGERLAIQLPIRKDLDRLGCGTGWGRRESERVRIAHAIP